MLLDILAHNSCHIYREADSLDVVCLSVVPFTEFDTISWHLGRHFNSPSTESEQGPSKLLSTSECPHWIAIWSIPSDQAMICPGGYAQDPQRHVCFRVIVVGFSL